MRTLRTDQNIPPGAQIFLNVFLERTNIIRAVRCMEDSLVEGSSDRYGQPFDRKLLNLLIGKPKFIKSLKDNIKIEATLTHGYGLRVTPNGTDSPFLNATGLLVSIEINYGRDDLSLCRTLPETAMHTLSISQRDQLLYRPAGVTLSFSKVGEGDSEYEPKFLWKDKRAVPFGMSLYEDIKATNDHAIGVGIVH